LPSWSTTGFQLERSSSPNCTRSGTSPSMPSYPAAKCPAPPRTDSQVNASAPPEDLPRRISPNRSSDARASATTGLPSER